MAPAACWKEAGGQPGENVRMREVIYSSVMKHLVDHACEGSSGVCDVMYKSKPRLLI